MGKHRYGHKLRTICIILKIPVWSPKKHFKATNMILTIKVTKYRSRVYYVHKDLYVNNCHLKTWQFHRVSQFWCMHSCAKFYGTLRKDSYRWWGTRMLLIPPNFTLIFRHKFERVWGDVFMTFLTWTHCVAIPRSVSPTRFTSAKKNQALIWKLFKVLRNGSKI